MLRYRMLAKNLQIEKAFNPAANSNAQISLNCGFT